MLNELLVKTEADNTLYEDLSFTNETRSEGSEPSTPPTKINFSVLSKFHHVQKGVRDNINQF